MSVDASNALTGWRRMPKVVRFGIIGGMNVSLGWAVIWTGLSVLGLSLTAANVLGYVLLFPIAFMGFARMVFDYSGELIRALPFFLGAFVVAFACNLGTVTWLMYDVGWPYAIAQFSGIAVSVVAYYLLNRLSFQYLQSTYARRHAGPKSQRGQAS